MSIADLTGSLFVLAPAAALAVSLVLALLLPFPRLRAKAQGALRRALARPGGECRHALVDTMCAIGPLLDVRSLDAALASRLRAALEVDEVALWVRDPNGDLYRRPGRASPAHVIADEEARLLDAWVAGPSPRPWYAAETAGDRGVERVLGRIGAALCFPLAIKGQPLGLLVLGPRRDGQLYLGEQRELLAVLASQVAAVAENARLYEALSESNRMLSESKRMLQRASRLSAIGTIAASLVHEIRNPLTAVRTFLQILPDRLGDPEVTEGFRSVALGELERVSKLIGELLHMARSPASAFEWTRLDDVADEVVRLLRILAERKRVELRRIGDALPEGYADAARLKQALLNLVMNAIQATPPGTAVTVGTRVARGESGRSLVEFAVQDQGPGVPPSSRETIFLPFHSTKESGTGLGLAVTRQIVAEHGGRIHVESEVGAGATFIVQVPLERERPATVH